jgi:carbon-monoxide dehydrogenase medium subunit
MQSCDFRPHGKRTIPVEQVPVSPPHSLKKGESSKPSCSEAPGKSSDAYCVHSRTEMDIAVVSAAVNLGGRFPCSGRSKFDDAARGETRPPAPPPCKPIDDKRGTIEFRTKVA